MHVTDWEETFAMTKRHTEQFACPHCKNESTRPRTDHINVDLTPEMREQVRDLSCFAWTCPVCGRTSLVIDPCLYHDMANQFMVWLSPEAGTPDVSGIDPLAGYCLRRVESPNAFREKIDILERGLDDRVIEMMKFLLALQLSHSMDVVEVVFHTVDGRTGAFTFAAVLGDGAEQYASMGADVYARIAQDVRERLFTPARDFLKIDLDWAENALELLKDA